MQAVSCRHTIGNLISYLKASGHGCKSGITEAFEVQSVTTHHLHGNVPALFVPLTGVKFDGHSYINEFLRMCPQNVALCGEYCVSSVLPEFRSRTIIVKNPLEAFQAMASGYRTSLKGEFLGITGSSGKTTFKHLLKCILQEDKPTYATPHNLNNHIGVPLTVLGIPRGSVYHVIEMGMNHAGEIARLCDICQPNVGIVTNIGPAHMQYFKSLEDIAAAKSELFAYVALRSGVNLGLATYSKYFSSQIQKSVRWIAEEWVLDGFNLFDGRLRFHREEKSLLELGIHTELISLAVAAAEHYHIPAQKVWLGLVSFEKWNRNLRGHVFQAAGCWIFLDCYNSNPQSFQYSLKRAEYFVNKFKPTSFVGWYGDMGELGVSSTAFHERILKEILQSHINCPKRKWIFFGEMFYSLRTRIDRQSSDEFRFYQSAAEAEAILAAEAETPKTFFHVKASRFMKLEPPFLKKFELSAFQE
jgi:UDP-N-acetylmuramoyl-tripeptide--D-alanyl-D-alanine ligase